MCVVTVPVLSPSFSSTCISPDFSLHFLSLSVCVITIIIGDPSGNAAMVHIYEVATGRRKKTVTSANSGDRARVFFSPLYISLSFPSPPPHAHPSIRNTFTLISRTMENFSRLVEHQITDSLCGDWMQRKCWPPLSVVRKRISQNHSPVLLCMGVCVPSS